MNKILISLLAGVGIGLLLAPDKGSETRKKIRNRVTDLRDSVEDTISDITDKSHRAYKNAKGRFEEALD